MIPALYAAIARRRREWYAAHPEARRRLRRPVISIGNIAAGGRGKTPFTAAVARMLMDLGERPAILSRGYARAERPDGVVVVRDADGIRADLARSGDEPFMLARQLPGAIVIASPDRYLGGRLAEHHLGATVHILDDGFQHYGLDRDVDIVLVRREDVDEGEGVRSPVKGRPPFLREPPDVLVAADAIVALEEGVVVPFDVPVFRARRTVGAAVFEDGGAAPSSVFAFAGIAEPSGFFDGAKAAGLTVAGTQPFADHHRYSSGDLDRLFAQARTAGASALLTTEKDYVRLLPHRPFRMRVGYLPLTMEPEPRAEFRQWLVSAMASARDIVLV
jgi:tetraacyldisaccharide 4'-kinase